MINKSKKFNHTKIENKWQKKWEKSGLYSPNLKREMNPFYNLWMFPYPSAEGLHVGTIFSSTGSDVIGRYMRMRGNEVFQPIGYDSFGIHSENYSIKIGETPQKTLYRTIGNYERQLKEIGHGYDWSRTVTTSSPDYYKWTQWLFIELFKAGLAYRKKAEVNWCPSCKTVIADEQVIHEDCERCGHKVEKKELEQWFFRITDYAERLLGNLKKIDWPQKIKITQTNWIGKSEGATIKFPIVEGSDPLKKNRKGGLYSRAGSERLSDPRVIKSFTTRPDTLYGATFFVLAPEHPVVALLLNSKFPGLAKRSGAGKIQSSKIEKVKKYIEKSQKRSKKDRLENKNITGVFTGLYVVNPATKKKIPIFVADYVLMEYGSGAIMGVPAHDERDWEFAKKYKLPISEVVSGGDKNRSAFDEPGRIINSGKWNGLKMPEDIKKIIEDIEKRGWGEEETSYHLRDWLISRQRYWGPPIPMIYCKKCAKEDKGWFTLQDTVFKGLLHKDQSDWESAGWYPEEKLPVELPFMKNYQPKGTGRGPLNAHPEFYDVKCPECGHKAKRETDVSDTFLDSSWYFLRYPSVGIENGKLKVENKKMDKKTSKNNSQFSTFDSQLSLPWDREVTKKWLPVDLYFGGAEHAVLHLMYARFVWMVLYDLGYLNFPAKNLKGQLGGPATMPKKALGWEEPFPRFYAHGLMIKDGAKMSKSKGNVVNPDVYIEKFGADTLRLYLMFMGPMDGYPDFRDTGIEGMRRFIEKVWQLFQIPHSEGVAHSKIQITNKDDEREIKVKMHQTIKKVTKDLENFHYNTAISAIMEFVNLLREKVSKSNVPGLAKRSGVGKGQMSKVKCVEWDEALRALAQLMAPFTPHLSEEIWVNRLGENYSIHKSKWPQFMPELVKEETVTIAIQVNGKLRATLIVKSPRPRQAKRGGQRSIVKGEVLKAAMADENVKKWLKGKEPRKVIFIPGRLVNFLA